MHFLHRFSLIIKAINELGPKQVGLYAWYRAALWSGYLRWRTPSGQSRQHTAGSSGSLKGGEKGWPEFTPAFQPSQADILISIMGQEGSAQLKLEVQEILNGKVRLFGGEPVPLELEFPHQGKHWTVFERKPDHWQGKDPKFIWEPGRFAWACTLARAYHLWGDERYAQAFWRYTELFLEANPPNIGPHWVSAQEVALRLMALTFSLGIFENSIETTPQRRKRLEAAIADHAARIPPTLAYARAQNNNHLLTEAVGLYTAGVCLPGHPRTEDWKKLGWRWINRSLQNQISVDGVYIQHSTNYHRLMLQAAIWAEVVAHSHGRTLPSASRERVAAATDWLFSLSDEESGRVPNLGHNDGAYILPFTVYPFEDYRPVVGAASYVFPSRQRLGPGPWDDMSLWLGIRDLEVERKEETESGSISGATSDRRNPIILRSGNSWAYLRCARFHSRPAHADQLHVDLWRRGVNVALDPGTYRYNAPPPWDNSLTSTQHHNSIALDGAEQMTRAGKFLYLDWAQAQSIDHSRSDDGSWERVIAEHNGYQTVGVTHRRAVTAFQNDRWLIEDHILPADGLPARQSVRRRATLHWILPDWSWEINENGGKGITLRFNSPWGWIAVVVESQNQQVASPPELRCQLVRAGKLLYGEGAFLQTNGWYSPTYGHKNPALSLSCQVIGRPPIQLKSEFILTPDSQEHP